MPWNRAGVTESPFVIVFREARIPAASNIMTFVVLTAALSGSNAALYAASPSFVFHGSNRMGASGFGPPQRRQVTTPRLCFFPRSVFWWRWCWRSGRQKMLSSQSSAPRWWERCCPGWSPWRLTSNSVSGFSPSQLAALPMRSPIGRLGFGSGVRADYCGAGWRPGGNLI